MILTGFECLSQAQLMMSANFETTSSNSSIIVIVKASIFEKDTLISFMKSAFFLLFLGIEHLSLSMCSSTIGIMTVRGT